MKRLTRRSTLLTVFGAAVSLLGQNAFAQPSRLPFSEWVERFRGRARARGISDATYTRVMGSVTPDKSVYALDRSQPEFNEQLWQYLNRRVSDWRIQVGRVRAKEQASLFSRIERDYGVDRHHLIGLWGMESAFGELVDNPRHMRPVFPALAALAWGEPRRRSYWEKELLNALVIVERGWAAPNEMIGSWAGAMGHTQWMPEVWLNVGIDYDKDGRISPFALPDALAGTARYLLERGKYLRGQPWGYEVRLPPGMKSAGGIRTTAAWQRLGVSRADDRPFSSPTLPMRLTTPVGGGPSFLIGQNFQAIRSYNPSFNYTLAIVHLGDRIRGEGPFLRPFPGGERTMSLAELQELQKRLTGLGFPTGGTDGRVGPDTMRAVAAFQRKVGLEPDGYPGLRVLSRLRQGN